MGNYFANSTIDENVEEEPASDLRVTLVNETKKIAGLDCKKALLFDKEGFVHEGTRANLFYTDGKTIFTPPKETVLDGVTQNTVIEALKKAKIKVVERALKKEELTSLIDRLVDDL
jgi:branched-subunit amino acid aminotransferase/4-amino-4-deoxychorismate lyase